MADTFQTFQKFNDPGLAAAIAEKLHQLHIESQINNERPIVDSNIVGANPVEPTIHLKIRSQDFNRAHQALEDYYQEQLTDVDPDYYLLSFTNKELLDIVAKPDEWGHFDYALAKKLLADQGLTISPAAAEALKQKRLKELARPSGGNSGWILLGYICAFLGGVPGLIIGYLFAWTKKTLPNGASAYLYPEGERQHGKRIFFISLVSLPLWILFKIGLAA